MSDARTFGIDIGGSSIKWAAVDGQRLVAHGSTETPRTDHRAVIDAMASVVREHWPDEGAIGVTVPGTVRPREGRTVFVPNLPGHWDDFAVADELAARTGRAVHLINDARAFAWAELADGAARDADGALFVTIGTGIGGAIAYEGRILVGEVDSIGEVGHVPVDPEGERCVCGGRGCLETVASGSAIAARLARTVATTQSTVLRRLTADGREPVTAKLAALAAREGDPWAVDAFDRAGAALGRAASTICLALQLDFIVIGGGMGAATDLLLPRLQDALDERQSLTGPIAARVAMHGTEAGAVGAARFAADRSLTTRTPFPTTTP